MASRSERTVPMQVLVLSLPRTGTRSMHDALSILLQEKVYHGFEMIQGRPPGKFWLNCIQAKYDGKGKTCGRDEFDKGLGSYAGTTDMPSCFLWKELMEAYPEAKVVFVDKDFEKWWPSFKVAAIGQLFNPVVALITYLEPMLGNYTATQSRKVVLDYFRVSSSSQLTKAKCREVFERHYADVRRACEKTPGRLLEMRIEDGWEPLCNFLDKPVPNVPFPRLNDVDAQLQTTNAHKHSQLFKGILAVSTRLTPLVVAGAAVWYYMRWRS